MNKVVSRLVYSHLVVLTMLFVSLIIASVLGAQLVRSMRESSERIEDVNRQISLSLTITQACTFGTLSLNDTLKYSQALAILYANLAPFRTKEAELLDIYKDTDHYNAVLKAQPHYTVVFNGAAEVMEEIPKSPPNVTKLNDLVYTILLQQYQYQAALNSVSAATVEDSKTLEKLVLVLVSVSCPLFFLGLGFELVFVFRPTVNMVVSNFKQYCQVNSQHMQAEQQLAQMSQNLTDAVVQKWQTIVQYRSIFDETVFKAEMNYQTYVRLGFYSPHAKKAHEELAAIINKRTAQLDSMRTQLEASEKYVEHLAQFKLFYDEHLSKRVATLKMAGVTVEAIVKAWQKEKRVFKDKNQVKLQGIASNILTYTMKNNLMEKILLRFSLFEVERGESLRFVLNRDLEEKNAMGLDGVDRVVLFGKRFHSLVKREHSTENWDFYRAVEEFKRARMSIPQLGQAIYKKFLIHGAPDPINLDSGTKSKVEKAVNAMIVGTKPWSQNVFDGAQSVIVELMASDSYKRFLRQAECAELYHELRKEEMKAKETLAPLFKFAERLKAFVLKFCMEAVKSGHYEQAQDLWAEGMKLFEKVGPVCIPEADALLASCQHEHTRIQEIVARQDLAAADKRACKLLSMMERLKKEWIKEFLATAREQQNSVLPLLRVDAIHRLEKQLKSIERSVRDLKLRGELVSVTRSSHEDGLDDSKAKESKTQSGGPEDQKKHWYAQSIIQKDDPEDEEKIRPHLARSETGDGDDDEEGDSPRSGSANHEDTPTGLGKRFTSDSSPTKHARSVDIRDLYDEKTTFDSTAASKEKSKNKKSKDDKSLVTEYFKKLTKGKIDDDDETASPKLRAQSKKATLKKAALKAQPVPTTTTMKDKTYTRVPSPEPSDILGESAQGDFSLRSIRTDSVEDQMNRIGETDPTTPRSISIASEASPLPTPIKIMAIPEEGRSDDETATPTVADDLTFTPNPLSDSVLLDSRPLK
eukprot:TRINITY_DN3858_c0_g1_i1.p1 TRINITY_DN3858_c0_g1~~TRINITY_DN3858_c0_g1_i1.p1  ORF type:complete len:1021 (+),score=179.48 TRINITY_DN3858_c0_g1_i1:125-3064(+)